MSKFSTSISGKFLLAAKEKELSVHEKTLFVYLLSICDKAGFCWKSDMEISKACRISKGGMSKFKEGLFKKGFISIGLEPDGIATLLTAKWSGNNIYSFLGGNQCRFCDTRTPVIHKHHYPIRKENGGERTIEICPNCHSEFHFLETVIIVNKEYR